MIHPDVKYPSENPGHDRQIEQAEYLNGVLWGDPNHRLDEDSRRDVSREIDQYGTCSRHFWRGVLDVWGSIGIYEAKGYSYPRVQLNGSYSFLHKFLAFLLETWPTLDPEGKLHFQCGGGRLLFSGTVARDIIVLLYGDAGIALTTNQQKADFAITWTPRR
jgi:hypothetical protein